MAKNYSVLLLYLLIYGTMGCVKSDASADSRPYVVATTMMLEDALINIGGGLIRVDGLMGPGVDPHLYRPTPSDFRKLEDASLIVYNGLYLEARLSELLGKMSDKAWPAAEVIPDSLKIEAFEYGGTFDPHVWFDVSLWIHVVDGLGKQLENLVPEEQEKIRQQTTAYIQELNILHHWVSVQIASIPENHKVLITAHDAFGYFGRAYAIEVRGLQGLSTQSDFGLQDVSSMVRYIHDRGIPAIFVESSISPRSIQSIQNGVSERGGQVSIGGQLYSDAMGDRNAPEGTYIGMVRHNVHTITKGLSQ